MVVFKYREEMGRKGSSIFRPVADIEFKIVGGEWIECHPYIDSGADVTLLPLSLGRLLGLEIEKDKIEELYGLAKQGIPVTFKNVEVKIGENEFETEIAWALSEEVVPLLGRTDIFDNFHVSFKQDHKIIELEWTRKGGLDKPSNN
jgi:hypothetical protein